MKPPSLRTLHRYGMTLTDWRVLKSRQGGRCAVCGEKPKWTAIDHEHVPGWKRMKGEERRKYVRGLLCYFCNFRYVGKCLTAEKARAVVSYLESYEARRNDKRTNL